MRLDSRSAINWPQAGDPQIKVGSLSYLFFGLCGECKIGVHRYVILWFHSSGFKKIDHDGQAQGQDCCSFSVVAALK